MKFHVFIALALATLTACDPFFILPGGHLEGAVAPTPGDWSFARKVKTIQLETNPADPYSVNIWAIGRDDVLYVHAGANLATWVEHMLEDPRVRVRFDQTLYELQATRVTVQAEFDAFSDAYETKYDRRPRNENVAEAYLFRLEARG